jgi:hypothetical protein
MRLLIWITYEVPWDINILYINRVFVKELIVGMVVMWHAMHVVVCKISDVRYRLKAINSVPLGFNISNLVISHNVVDNQTSSTKTFLIDNVYYTFRLNCICYERPVGKSGYSLAERPPHL